MGKTIKHSRANIAQSSRPRTRQNRPKLADPINNTNNLNARLRSLGLYAANTVGDGNCLFRALSDQLFGSPSKHADLRHEICDFIDSRKDEYAGFIEDERGIDVHLQCMRQLGTYGGHVEMSAFARSKKRDVKVVQPDVVYVLEHASLSKPWDDDPDDPRNAHRRKIPRCDFPTTPGTIYIAYHDWEHFSSVRNLTGPHHGLPKVEERPDEEEEPEPSQSLSKHKLKTLRAKPASSASAKSKSASSNPLARLTRLAPHAIPLPDSRSSSPAESSIVSTSSGPSAATSSIPSSVAPLTPPDGHMLLRAGRSPKRSFAESDGDDTQDGSVDGRRTKQKPSPAPLPPSVTPSDLGSLFDCDSDSDLSPPPPDPEEIERDRLRRLALSSKKRRAGTVESELSPGSSPAPPDRPMTRRQRKQAGLPKPRNHVIVIPGGKHPARLATKQQAETERSRLGTRANTEERELAEWEKSGTGRVDSRGFKELRI